MRVLIVRNNYNPKALEASLLLEAFFDKQHIDYQTYDRDDLRSNCSIIDQFPTSEEPAFNLAVVLGGDGTILCTANQIGTRRIPILGVNFGHLGFMANPNDEGIIQIVSEALAGEVSYEARTNLQVEVYCENDLDATAAKQDDFEVYPLIHEKPKALSAESADPSAHSVFVDESTKSEGSCDRHTADPILKGEGEPQRFFALNEMVIARGDQGRMIGFSYSVSDSLIANMRSDGLLASSAASDVYKRQGMRSLWADHSLIQAIKDLSLHPSHRTRFNRARCSLARPTWLRSTWTARQQAVPLRCSSMASASRSTPLSARSSWQLAKSPRSSCAIRQNPSTITPPKLSSSNKGQACLEQRTWADLRSARIARSSTRFYFNLITSM